MGFSLCDPGKEHAEDPAMATSVVDSYAALKSHHPQGHLLALMWLPIERQLATVNVTPSRRSETASFMLRRRSYGAMARAESWRPAPAPRDCMQMPMEPVVSRGRSVWTRHVRRRRKRILRPVRGDVDAIANPAKVVPVGDVGIHARILVPTSGPTRQSFTRRRRPDMRRPAGGQARSRR